MAEIGASRPWTFAEVRAQFAAITRLRWRILRNSMRRKGGMGDLLATLVMIPIFLFVLILPAFGAGAGAFYLASHGDFKMIAFILWAIFALCQLASIQLGQPGTTFDPTQLIRFPLSFRGYAVIRTFFGLLSPANAISTLMSFMVAVGITVAIPGLWIDAFTALAAFALVNIFFTRMLFAWVDRWLSTRRAREIFTGVLVVGSLGFQYLNFSFNPGLQHGHQSHAKAAARLAAATGFYHRAEPALALLPPGLTVNSLIAARTGHIGVFLAEVCGTLLFAAVFFTIFALRLYKEFRGESFSDVANAVAKAPAKKVPVAGEAPVTAAPMLSSAPPSAAGRSAGSQTVAAVFQKEFITLRRNTGIFYSLVAPLVMVVLFANMKAARAPVYILFPSAVAYTMMGIAPLCYNSLGLEAAGIQFFFLAPVRMRSVFLAKNLLSIALALTEIAAVFVAITYVAHAPSPMMTLSVLLWAVFTMSISLAVGNHRSVTAPKKVDLSKSVNKQASPLSALISIGLLLVCAGAGASVMLLASYFSAPWILPPSMLVLAIAGVLVYMKSLGSLDRLLADHRDTLSEVLCKA